MNRKYTDETKTAVIAALLAGQSVSQVARDYDIPKGTVSSWRSKELDELTKKQLSTQKKTALGEMILGLLEAELIALQEITRMVQDERWIKMQTASDLAVFYGVMQDKAFRKIEALDRNAKPND